MSWPTLSGSPRLGTAEPKLRVKLYYKTVLVVPSSSGYNRYIIELRTRLDLRFFVTEHIIFFCYNTAKTKQKAQKMTN